MESGVEGMALTLLSPRLVPSPSQLQLSLSSLPLPPYLSFLLSPPLPLPPASGPSSSMDSLPVQIQRFLGGHPASFPHVALDPDLIQVPRTIGPSSLFWPLKQT